MTMINAEIIATIKSGHLSNIFEGIKKVELRKTVPHGGLPFKVYWCESGSGGKIKGESIIYRFDYLTADQIIADAQLFSMTGVTEEQLRSYAKDKPVYVWHILRTLVYPADIPFYRKSVGDFGLTRPPQSWCYVEEV